VAWEVLKAVDPDVRPLEPPRGFQDPDNPAPRLTRRRSVHPRPTGNASKSEPVWPKVYRWWHGGRELRIWLSRSPPETGWLRVGFQPHRFVQNRSNDPLIFGVRLLVLRTAHTQAIAAPDRRP